MFTRKLWRQFGRIQSYGVFGAERVNTLIYKHLTIICICSWPSRSRSDDLSKICCGLSDIVIVWLFAGYMKRKKCLRNGKKLAVGEWTTNGNFTNVFKNLTHKFKQSSDGSICMTIYQIILWARLAQLVKAVTDVR